MSRIQAAYPLDEQELADLTPMERLNRQQAAILAHRPELGDAIAKVSQLLASGEAGTLSLRLIELIRIRIAFWNQCRSCMSVRYVPDAISEELVCSLERPEEADDLTEAERSALRFADLFATNHLAIDDEHYDDLRRHFSEDELVQIGFQCALMLGIGRLAATWDVVEGLPDRFQTQTAGTRIAPGGGDVLRVTAAR
jgi:alkylhydroperoxidase family enzyme